ncbi:MAG: hypothetical protein U9N42_07430 [Campylobacterota bacterium]|nr:hypothetical protein [Campylobacterota bacterium]
MIHIAIEEPKIENFFNNSKDEIIKVLRYIADNNVSFEKDLSKKDFTVSTIEDVQNRVSNAENSNKYTSHDKFWNDLDNKIEAL